MGTNERAKLKEIKKLLTKCENEVREIANSLEDEAIKLSRGTTRQVIKSGNLNYKAHYLYESIDNIKDAKIHL